MFANNLQEEIIMKKVFSIALLFSFIYLVGCSSVSVKTDYDPGTDFTTFKTFKIYDGKPVEGDELVKHPISRKRVFASVEAKMIAMGYKLQESGDPDIFVVIHAGSKEKIQVTNYGGSYGPYGGYGWYGHRWGAYGYGGGTDVYQYDETTLVIDIVDMPEKEMVWRGMGTGIVQEYSDIEDKQAQIDLYVGKILDGFPPEK